MFGAIWPLCTFFRKQDLLVVARSEITDNRCIVMQSVIQGWAGFMTTGWINQPFPDSAVLHVTALALPAAEAWVLT